MDRELQGVAEKLMPRFASGAGPLDEWDVVHAVDEAAARLRDAPITTFVPLLAEHRARRMLRRQLSRRRRR